MVASALQIDSPKELEAWLQDKPADWAQLIAVRSALRVFPLVFSVVGISEDRLPAAQAQGLILSVWRAVFISWAARKYPARDMKIAATTA